jgi:hypothetical protein
MWTWGDGEEIICPTCKVERELRNQLTECQSENHRFLEMLKRLEWINGFPSGCHECAICCHAEYEGHADDCELALLLSKVEGE